MAQRDVRWPEHEHPRDPSRDEVAERGDRRIAAKQLSQTLSVIGWMLMIAAGGVALFVPQDRRAGGYSTFIIAAAIGAVGLVLIGRALMIRKRMKDQTGPGYE